MTSIFGQKWSKKIWVLRICSVFKKNSKETKTSVKLKKSSRNSEVPSGEILIGNDLFYLIYLVI